MEVPKAALGLSSSCKQANFSLDRTSKKTAVWRLGRGVPESIYLVHHGQQEEKKFFVSC